MRQLSVSTSRFAVVLLCLVLGVAPCFAQSSAGSSGRVALVIGNAAYQHVPRLANPGNDATLVAATLRQLGFTLIGGGAQDNLDKAQFDQAVQAFGRAIQGADVVLFYYAGHGLQVDGNNWLVPVDANPTRPQDLDFQMVNAELVLQQMNGAGTRLNLVVLDACRNNPFSLAGTRATGGGLAQMKAPDGTMIAFATQPGAVATDGSGADGPYAVALTAAMRQPGLDIFRTFNRVGLTVQHASNGVQVPWVSSSPIDGEFFFTATEGSDEAGMASGDLGSVLTASSAAVPIAAGDVARHALQAPQPAANGTVVDGTATSQATAGQTAPGQTTASRTSATQTTGSETPASQTKLAAGAGPAQVAALQAKAATGDADAELDLGLAYVKGVGVAKDAAVARQWFERAAGQGVARAQYDMGLMLERGLGGSRSYAEALGWYRRAADQGFPSAEVALGRFYGRGLGVPRDVAQRTDWYRRAALHGNSLGEWALGNFCQFGDGVPKDMAQAIQWFQRAAGQGFAPAEARLGLIYEHGIGVPRDHAEALHWFRKAAAVGNPIGLNNLGFFYRQGMGVPKDYTQAMRLFRQAADKGSPMGEYNIGLLYEHGHGVAVDREQAHMWFEKAAAAGNQPAIDILARQHTD